MHPFVQTALSLDLTDVNSVAQKPADIFRQSSGSGIEGSESVFDLAVHRIPLDVMLPDVAHQMIKGDIVLNQAFIVWVFYLHLLGNARTNEGKPVCDSQFFSCVYG